ncbi:hypothetical protein ACP4OV_021566 [Aristida adscensionis]
MEKQQFSELDLKRDPNRERTWEEKAVKVLDICREQMPRKDPNGNFMPISFFDLEKRVPSAGSPIPEYVSTGGGSQVGDVDMCDLLRRSELTWEEKVVEVLHIVRCQEFTEYDPKNDDYVQTRFSQFNIAFFDFEKESMIGFGPPLSELGASGWLSFESSVNVISLKIVESDVGYPIRVFGTVLARDALDYKRVYLFRRDSGDPQLITSLNDTLTLTGPYRGLAVTDSMFFEIDLWIKFDETGDRVLGKGVIEHNAIRYTKKAMSWLVTSWLSTVELVYAPVQFPVEATVAVNILRGPCNFTGKVTGWTFENHENHVILYDTEAAGTRKVLGDDGSIPLSRCVVAVPFGEKLVLTIFVSGGDEGCTLTFGQYDDDRQMCNIGPYELLVKVIWTGNVVGRRKNVFKKFGRTMLLW